MKDVQFWLRKSGRFCLCVFLTVVFGVSRFPLHAQQNSTITIVEPGKFLRSNKESETTIALTLLNYIKFNQLHGDTSYEGLNIEAMLENKKRILCHSEVVSITRNEKCNLHGPISCISFRGEMISVPEYYIACQLMASERSNLPQTENHPKTIKDYSQYPVTKLANDNVRKEFHKKFKGFFNLEETINLTS